jgi:hypothetical protein
MRADFVAGGGGFATSPRKAPHAQVTVVIRASGSAGRLLNLVDGDAELMWWDGLEFWVTGFRKLGWNSDDDVSSLWQCEKRNGEDYKDYGPTSKACKAAQDDRSKYKQYDLLASLGALRGEIDDNQVRARRAPAVGYGPEQR